MWQAFNYALKSLKVKSLEKKLQGLTRLRDEIKGRALNTQARYEKAQRELKEFLAK
jgi:hypothetical protein